MEFILRYIIISSVSLAILFIVYKIIFRKSPDFRSQRFFLIISLIISLVLPFNNFCVDVHLYHLKKENTINASNNTLVLLSRPESVSKVDPTNRSMVADETNWFQIISIIYLCVSLAIILRIIFQLSSVLICYIKNKKLAYKKYSVVINNSFSGSFTFINIIFINKSVASEEDFENIIAHELIHIKQLHFFDLFLSTLTSIILWFNPFVWLIKKEIHQNHEYLADKGVVDSGIDKLSYQALLINHVAESKLINLTSGFNNSLIKKRIMMMSSTKEYEKNIFKLFCIIPFIIVLFFAVSCVNKESNSESIPAIEIPNMYPLFVGMDNPIQFSVSGYNVEDLEAEINPGTLKLINGQYFARVDELGSAILTISYQGKEIQKIMYPVKVPDSTLIKAQKGQLDPKEITPGYWIDGLNIDENEYLQLVYWLRDSLTSNNNNVPVGMNVLYTKIDNHIEIPATIYDDEITVEISNGEIFKKDNHFIVQVPKIGKAIISVKKGDKLLQKKEFIVKTPEFISKSE